MSRLVVIPGRTRLKVPTIFDRKQGDTSAVISRSPEWMVSLFPLTKGNITVAGSKNFIELYGWTSEASRYVSGDLSGTLLTSGSVKSSNLVLIIPPGPHGPKIEAQMYKGTLLAKIIILRLGWTQGINEKFQELQFEKARLVGFQQNMQYLVISAQVAKKANDITVFSQDTGKSSGHKLSSVNYSTDAMTIENK